MSSLPSDLPKLPKWPFYVFDVLLLVTAAAIAWNNPGHLVGIPLFAVLGCVILAAALCTIPLVVDYLRSQDEALDERQRALEALSATVASSAEQIGIASQGLSQVAEATQLALKQVEQVPQKLQKSIADLQQRLDSARDEEIEELERDLAALRGSEGDKLESASDKIHKITAELSKIEASASKHLLSVTEVLGRAEQLADKAAGKLTQAADESASRMSAALSRTINSAQDSAKEVISSEQKRVLDAISAKIDASLGALEAQSSKAAVTLEAKIALLEAVVANLKAAIAEASRISAPVPAASSAVSPAPAEPGEPQTPASDLAAPEASLLAEPSAPKRARKAKREQALADSAVPLAQEPEPTPAPQPELAPAAEEAPAPDILAPAEPAALETALKPEPVPSAPPTAPLASPVPEVSVQTPVPQPSETLVIEAPAAPEPVQNEFSQISPEELSSDTAVSADGATRLIVTAYIGIGNRLYIRGDGPGLSWEKGLPLQFVSIGKWRWESAEASAPVKIKLLKNDQMECASVGEITLAPGHQAEVTANF
jgi:hypothetical protein